jgi:phosphoglycolate phosphatase-like HAD superfamily hydrolase
MKSIAVRFVAHHGADKLQEAGADRVVESLEEVAPEDFLRLIGE